MGQKVRKAMPVAAMDEEKEVEELIEMINRKMESGVNRLGVSFSDKIEEGTVKESHFHGRKDTWNPGVWGERHGER